LLERMLESKISMQKLDVAEGDILKDIQEQPKTKRRSKK